MYLSPLLLVPLVVFLFLSALAIFALYRIKTSECPYLKREYFLTKTEKDFYTVLSKVVSSEYLLFSKVRMSDLLYLPKMSNSNYYHYQNKIQSKHVDFLLCDKENIKPLLAIELDDPSHLKVERILRDTLVDKIFESAQLPILHIQASSSYQSDELLKQIEISLKRYDLPTDDTLRVA